MSTQYIMWSSMYTAGPVWVNESFINWYDNFAFEIFRGKENQSLSVAVQTSSGLVRLRNRWKQSCDINLAKWTWYCSDKKRNALRRCTGITTCKRVFNINTSGSRSSSRERRRSSASCGIRRPTNASAEPLRHGVSVAQEAAKFSHETRGRIHKLPLRLARFPLKL